MTSGLSKALPQQKKHSCITSGKPVRYRINGKSDFTLSGRKQRHYHEFDYVMEFIGEYNRIEFLPPTEISCKKSIPVKQTKVIDERKAFY
ncbi:MAG: hypothetical protein DRI97_07210 [Bacteroidetes bacterium]|nr:MAG: hypothetical protein DRI97_07210 [Bacteroidota bacterium]RLD76390.1 MAG: hypothetical protein DRJ15_15415 [Bacteroidota bacterium]